MTITKLILIFCFVLFNLQKVHLSNPNFTNGNSSSSTPLLTQPQSYLSACMVLPHFSFPTQNGVINVSCSITEQSMDFVLLNLFISEKLTLDQFLFMRNKSAVYLSRDSFLSICVLKCSRGNPPSRSRAIYNDVMEPAGVNIGCDDIRNLQCIDTCSSSELAVENGNIVCSEDAAFGSVCRVQCHSGFESRGPTMKLCNTANGTWSPEQPFTCQAASCPMPDQPAVNGVLQCTNSNFHGSVCNLQCNEGYVGNDGMAMTCNQNRWVPQLAIRCERVPTCTPLSPVANGRVVCDNGNSILSRCWLVCDRGYSPNGANIRWCLPTNNGTSWSVFTRDNTLQAVENHEEMSCQRVNDRSGGFFYQNMEKSASSLLTGNGGSRFSSSQGIVCDIQINQRKSCGNNKVTREICQYYNCCWDDTGVLSHPCYFSPNTSLNHSVESERGSFLTTPLTTTQSTTEVPVVNSSLTTNQLAELINAAFELEFRSLLTNLGIGGRPTTGRGNRFPPRPAATPLMQCNDCNNPPLSLRSGPFCSYQPYLPQPDYVNGKSFDLTAPLENGTSRSFNRTLVMESRIFRGTDATPRTWPWHAIVYFNNKLCGGTLIREDLVLTAAHCVSGPNKVLYQEGTVALGVRNISVFRSSHPVLGPNIQRFNSLRVLRHTNFTQLRDGRITNDIALIKLDGRADVTGDYVKTLCLPTYRAPTSDDCYVTGFGGTQNDATATILQQACLPIVSTPRCQEYFRGAVIPNQHICAGRERANTADTCQGDSGGPLVCRRRGPLHTPTCGWYLAGITSFGNSPCGSGSPSVFVDVYQYRNWIIMVTRLIDYLYPHSNQRRV